MPDLDWIEMDDGMICLNRQGLSAMYDDESGLDLFHGEDVLPVANRWMTLGFAILGGALALGTGLAIAFKVNVQVSARGEVRPDQPIQIVQTQMAGTIASIDVAENDLVVEGQAIARLQDPALPDLERQLQEAAQELERLTVQQQVISAQVDALEYIIITETSTPDTGNGAEVLETALARLASQNPAQLGRYRRFQADLATVKDAVAQQQTNLETLQQQISQRVLLAPVDGTILQLAVQNPGQLVQPGMEIARILPTETDLVIEAQVAVQDIGSVEVGQLAQMRVSAYPYPDYGILNGIVTAIAPDTVPCPQPACPSDTVYEITIQPEQTTLYRGDRAYPLQPGMEVSIDIISRRERVIHLLFRSIR
jgi:HlyD family secretion protein